jgi:hypothetical protein
MTDIAVCGRECSLQNKPELSTKRKDGIRMTSIRRATVTISGIALVGGITLAGFGGSPAFAANACVNPSGAGGCFTSIQSALNASPAGATINVKPGTYQEDITISKPISLLGASASSTVIVAASTTPQNGVTITKVKGKTVLSGFTIEDAPLAGISVQRSSGVVISNNVVQGNDKNLDISDPQNPTCNGALSFDEQDCGEGINLNAVVSSVVQSNLVQNNAGGVLLSDDFGKNHANVVEDNGIQNNFSPPGFLDCGVTLASHPNAFGTGLIVPGSGVFKNTITRNSSTNNGCGIGFFDSSPGTKTYDNTVSQNVLAGNGLAGIAMHAIGTGQDMSGNQLIGNWIGLNNTFGDAAAGDTQTTGVLAWSVISPVQGLVIKNNNIVGGNHFGIFITGPIQAKVSGNEIDAAVHEHKG